MFSETVNVLYKYFKILDKFNKFSTNQNVIFVKLPPKTHCKIVSL